MARIPVEKDHKGTPWWLWLLGILLIIALIWLLVEWFDNDDDDVVVQDPIETVEPLPSVDTGVITSVATLLAANDISEYVGRQVRLDNMYVTAVPGDSIFFVRPGGDSGNMDAGGGDMNSEIIAASLAEESTPTNMVEGRYDVNPGQTITLYGVVRELSDGDLTNWGLTQDELSSRGGKNNFYIRVNRIENLPESAVAPSVQ